MKGLYISLCFILSAGYSFSQSTDILLTGVFDGPLTGGQPKGVEVYVFNDVADLSIYGIGSANNGGGTDMQEFTFPAEAATAGTYLYIVDDMVGFMNFAGFAANYESSAMGINGDDAIELFKDGVVVDVFGDINVDGNGTPWEYLDGWASRLPSTSADGSNFVLGHWVYSGPDALDNTTSNSTADNPIPFASFGNTYPADVTIEASNFAWTPSDVTIEVGQVIRFVNVGGFHNIDFSQATYPNNPDGSKNGDASTNLWVYNYSFNIPGVYDFECNPHAGNGMVGTITVNVPAGPNYVPSTVGAVTTVDAVGVPDSINATVALTGIVYGIDYSGGAANLFTLIDNTGGISVSAPGDVGYTVQEGDQLSIKGTIGVNTGMTRINADSITVVSTGNALASPTVITLLDESTESEFVRINNLTLVDASEWLGDGSSFNVNTTDGTTNFLIRVDSDSEVADRPAPVGTFDLIGLGAQFDTDSPYDDGYQIFPRYNSDIIQMGALPIAADDELTLDVNENGSINVVANDFLAGDFASMTILDTPTLGQATATDSTISYMPFQDDCGMETIRYEVCNTVGACDTANLVINILCPPTYPAYDIADLTTVNTVGYPDSFDVVCAVTGVVYGINYRPAGTQFTIIDENDADAGIGVFKLDDGLGYTVTEGDKVTIKGKVDFFNGLIQMDPDEIELISSNSILHAPEIVTALSDETDSKFIKIEGLTLVDATQWSTTGSFNADVTDGTSTFILRVDSDTNILGLGAPTQPFSVTGIGSQFDDETPWDSDYQIIPRYLTDIDFSSSTRFLENFENQIQLFPNPASSFVKVQTELDWTTVEIYNLQGTLIRLIENRQNNISLEGMETGMYQMLFKTDEGFGIKRLQLIK